MTIDNYLDIARILIDFFKATTPYTFLLLLLCFFYEDIKFLIRSGGLKISAPGLTIESIQNQQEKVDDRSKKELEKLNTELLTAKHTAEKLKKLQEDTAKDKDHFFVLYHFEKTYRVIFPSQMAILNFMNNSPDKEISEDIARAIHRRTIWASQFKVTFDEFMDFMIQSGLINFNDKRNYSLEPVGLAFWEYIKSQNMFLKLPANDMVDTIKKE